MRGFHLESHGGFRVGDELQVLLSSVTPVVKYIFQRSTVQPIGSGLCQSGGRIPASPGPHMVV
jgi:hypothetical protein